MAIEHHVVLSCLVQRMGTQHFQWMNNMSRVSSFFTAKTGGCHSPKNVSHGPTPRGSDLADTSLVRWNFLANLYLVSWFSWDLAGSGSPETWLFESFWYFLLGFLGIGEAPCCFRGDRSPWKMMGFGRWFFRWLVEPAPWNRGHSVGILPAGLTRTDIFDSTNRCQKLMPTMLILTFTDLFQDSSVNCAFSLSSDFFRVLHHFPC